MLSGDIATSAARRLLAASFLAIGLASWAQAQSGAYPNRPIHFIVPYAVGGATDVLTRVTAEAMAKSIGQAITIENRAGAGVIVGSSYVAKAPPDGYTMLITTSAHSINQTLFRKLPYDSDKDFEPIAILGKVSFVLLTRPDLKVNDLASFIDLLRKNPGKHSFGSAGLGSPMHVGPELFKSMTSTFAVHIPYRGETAALNDLLGGQTAFMYASPATAAPHIKAGTVRPLAVTSLGRSALLPNVPTMSEAGLKAAETYSWIVLMAPAGTPRAIIDMLNREAAKALSNPDVRTRMADFGFEVDTRLSPTETREFIRAEALKWAPIVKASGAVAE